MRGAGPCKIFAVQEPDTSLVLFNDLTTYFADEAIYLHQRLLLTAPDNAPVHDIFVVEDYLYFTTDRGLYAAELSAGEATIRFGRGDLGRSRAVFVRGPRAYVAAESGLITLALDCAAGSPASPAGR